MRYRSGFAMCLVAVLFLLAACGGSGGTTSGSSSTSAGVTTVQVIETDYAINASQTSFIPGKAYHFVVTNNGATAHEFMIMPKSEGNMNGMSMSNMDKMALASIDNINPGESKTLNYTFPASLANSHPEFACYLPGHYEAGMKQEATVQS